MIASILLVDDDAAMRRTFGTLLRENGYAVSVARSVDDAETQLAASHFDLLVLDVMMPKRNGFALCEAIRKTDRRIPIIFLTSFDGETNQVRSFGLGADDCISKTVGDAEFLARIRRAIARVGDYGEARSGASPDAVVALGRMRVDLAHRRVYDGEAECARLSATEVDLLRTLLASRGKVVATGEIVDRVWGVGYTIEPATIRRHVSNLKEKLREGGELISNERGFGYCLL